MEMMQGASLLSRPADEFGNDGLVEEMWAVKAMDHAEVYFNLLTSVHPSCIKLTPYDDQIYQTFRQDFPNLKVDVVTDDTLKSPSAKHEWRQFAEKFNKLEDYSYGTLMRANAAEEFSPDNSILVVRIQFLAIEIARNREGYNNDVHQKFRPAPKSSKEFKATVCTAKVAGPQKEIKKTTTTAATKNSDSAKDHNLVLPTTSTAAATTSSPSAVSNTNTSSLSSSAAATSSASNIKMCKLFTFIDDTYRDIRRYNSGLYKNSFGTQLMQTINKYKNGCNEIFGKVLESHDMCLKLSQNIVRTLDIFKQLSTFLSDLEEYQYRVCEIMSIFIVCELRLSVDNATTSTEQLAIAHRIIYIMRRHLVQEEEDATLYNILRTLVYIPKLYNAREIMCAIFGEFLPIKPVLEVNILPDKLYMLYIIVFYRWMMMQKDDDDKLLIVNFAESFMKPSVSLCSNNLYGSYLPLYTTHSTATRTILNNLKFYRDIRNACIIDNALKTIGSIVNLCDDDEDDDVIVVEATSPASDFAQVFAKSQMEPLNGSMSNIKLEEKTVVGTVDLTEEEEEITANTQTGIVERHDKWLNDFQQLAKQYREAQLLLEKQQNNQLISNSENEAVICLDSDSEGEEEIAAVFSKETTTKAVEPAKETSQSTAAANQHKPCEDLFVDSYPLTTTPIHCDTDLESLEADDNDDVTKISSRFLTGTLRTYQAKKSNQTEIEDTNNSSTDNQESYQETPDINKAYRRDSIHISSSPPEEHEEDDGTDVQDEHDDDDEDALLNEERDDEEEANAYTFLPTESKKTVKEIFAKQIRPMGPYPTYNNMQTNDKVVFSQTVTRYQQPQQQDRHYYSDSSEAKTPKKQKKRVQFNTSPLGPTVPTSIHKMPLKPAIQQQKFKASDAPEYFHLRDFDCLSCSGSIAGSSTSNSTSSSIKQQEHQEHLAAAATLFRNIFDRSRKPYTYSGPFSPTSFSLSSHPPTPSSTTRKKSRLPKNKKSSPLRRPTMGTREDLNNMPALEERNSKEMFSIIRNREDLPQPTLGTNRYQESSDEFYGIVSDSDIVNNERYRNDAKLRKRCAVVITPTKELIQYERKRDQMYNEILLKQRRKLEMRALEKQREKERRRLERREEMTEQTIALEKGVTSAAIQRDRDKKLRRKSRSYTEVFMSSESEFETNFQVRTRRQTKQNVKDLQQPLNIQIDMTEASTNSLLSQIDAHLEEPRKPKTLEQPKVNVEKELPNDEDIKKKTCDITNDKGQTKMREHNNLLADIVQHLSPYQLDLPETNKTTPATEATLTDSAKEKVTVTEHIILQQSFDNLLEKTPTPQTQLANNEQQQMATTPPPTPSYAHEPKLNTAANFNSSPSADEMPQQENNTPLKKNNENSTLDSNKESKQIDETLEQILEESISVFKSVTSPGNLLNENTKARTPNPNPPPQTANSATTIPIIISNVKSLNNLEQSDKLLDKTEHLLNKETETCGSDDVLKTQIKEKAKEQIQAPTTAPTLLSSTILSNAETSLLAADGGDLSNISSETEIVQALKVPSLMAADLSDISLESEISKHLPDIAEPSPVVTDMSDNSNESQAFNHLHNPSTTMAAVMSLPDLPLEMPLATTNLPANPSETLDSNFQHQFSTTLNTPTKLASIANNQNAQSVNDLNTPLKFPLPTDLENSEQTPLKSVLEPETDNNVTKFLDLILNKTVTDAESETRDKIIKELNALTADSTGTSTTEAANECCDANNELTKVTELTEDITANAGNNKSLDIETAVEMDNQTLELPKTLEAQEEKQQQQQVKENLETLKTLENSQESSGLKANEEQTETPTPSANNDEELNPPKETAKAEPPNPMKNKSTTTPQKQTFNIKCRVRLKRLNIDEHQHCKSSNKETWMAIPLTKPEETDKSANNIDMKNCDNTATISKIDITTSSSLIKKPCLKYNSSKRASEEEEEEQQPNKTLETTATEEVPLVAKKAKLEKQVNTNLETTTTNVVTTPEQKTPSSVVPSTLSAVSLTNSKIKTKPLKTVTFDLSNLNEELRDSTSSSTSSSSYHNSSKHKTKNHQALGCYLKSNHRAPKKLPDNTLRAAETLQLFVNTINDSTRTPPPAEFNKKRSPIKNKCIAEDETPRPPPASTLMGTPPCKKSCTDKARSQISSTKCKDQLVSSLPAPSISTITSDITTARIYTSSPLDQTLPEYDDNVDTVADTELILPTTTGSLRRKLKRPKKSLTRPEPTDDTSTDDISNQPECNGEDDTDAVVDNEDDVFVEELLPIPAANEHILEEIVSARPTHMGTGTVIRDDYMNIEATATVPVYLFNDESRDLATPEPIQSSGDTTNVVDSSSYLNNSSSPAAHNVMATATASTTSTSSSSAALGNLEKSMLSPSEHEVSSTQETFYQTPTKSKQNGGESFGDKSSSTTTKDKGGGGVGGSSSCSMMGGQKLKSDELNFQNKQQEDDQTSSTTGLLQNNQVDTTNHSPEMCTLTLTPTTTTTSTTTSMTSNNRKMRKVSTHDEILFNELQQQQQQQQQIQQAATTKRKNLTTTTTFCAESTSDNNCKTKVINNNPLDMGVKSNGALNKEDKFKKLLKEVCKRDKNLSGNELEVVSGGVGGLIQGSNTIAAGGGGGGGSSPSTTTIINEDKISRSKRKKQKSSKSSKSKTHNERCTKIVLKASKLSAHVPTTTNPLIITIPKSRILIPPPTPSPPPPTEGEKQEMEEFIDIPNAKLFTEKEKDNTMLGHNQQHHHLSPSKPAQTLNSIGKKEWHQSSPTAAPTKSKRSHSPVNNTTESANIKTSNVNVNESKEVIRSSTSNKETKEKSAGSSTTKNSLNEIKTNNIVGKEKLSGSTTAIKKKTKTSSSSHSSSSSKSNNTINNHNNSSGDIKELVFVKDKYDLIKSKEKSHHNNSDLQENKEKLKEKTTSQQTKTSTKDKIKEKHKNEKSNNIKYDISLPTSNKNSSSTHSSASSNKTSNSRSSKSSSSNFSSSSSTSSTNLSANNTILKSKTNLSTHASAQANTQNNAAAASMLTTPTSSTSNTALVGGGSVTISTHHVRKKLKTK